MSIRYALILVNFRSALQKQFQGNDKVIHLSDDTPEVFGLFVHWLYGQNILRRKEDTVLFVELYVLAERLEVPDLEESTLVELHRTCFIQLDFLHAQEVIIRHVLAHTRTGSRLQQFFA